MTVMKVFKFFGKFVLSRPFRILLAIGGVVMAAIYIPLPVDLIPDVIPIVGWIDDFLGMAGALVVLFRVVLKSK